MTRKPFAKALWLTVCILGLNAWNASALNIILTNDDGYDTENIQALFRALEDAGHDVILSAPFENQSGTSGYVAFLAPIAPPEGQTWGVMMVAEDQHFVAASPVAAVLYGIDVLAPAKWGKGPDLVLSGPNEGNNTGLITVHSGTVGAAVTAINKGYPAIALNGAGGVLPANPEVNAALSVKLVESLQASGGPLLPINTGLNVNLPAFAGCTSADDYKFVFTKIGISAQWGIKFYERLGDYPGASLYVPLDSHSLPGVAGANPITAAGYPADDDPASEQNALDSGVVTISVIEGTYQADAAKEAIVQFKLRDLVSGLHPDFNGDGAVDIDDLVRLMESWGQDDPLADIAPPLGDGAVDVLDLEFLVGCWGQEIDDPTLIARWPLDEIEGMTAHDSAGDQDSTVMGLPVWHPDGGQVDGALEFNGMTFIIGGSVLNPSDGPFSVLAWIKGGQPGQGIITQRGGVDWLMADAVDGKLETELSRSLCSQNVITDGDWHRIGVTWDGSACRLYVDNVLEAEGTEDGLAGSAGKVIIGCRKTMAPGTYWTGLIDDVRIYDRAVRP